MPNAGTDSKTLAADELTLAQKQVAQKNCVASIQSFATAGLLIMKQVASEAASATGSAAQQKPIPDATAQANVSKWNGLFGVTVPSATGCPAS